MAEIIDWDHTVSENSIEEIEEDLDTVRRIVESGKVSDVVFLILTKDGVAHFKWAGSPNLMDLLSSIGKVRLERELALLEYMKHRLVDNMG